MRDIFLVKTHGSPFTFTDTRTHAKKERFTETARNAHICTETQEKQELSEMPNIIRHNSSEQHVDTVASVFCFHLKGYAIFKVEKTTIRATKLIKRP